MRPGPSPEGPQSRRPSRLPSARRLLDSQVRHLFLGKDGSGCVVEATAVGRKSELLLGLRRHVGRIGGLLCRR